MIFAYRGREGQVVVDEADGGGAIAHGGGHAFHRAVPDVADGEHTRGRGLQQEGSPLQGPVLTGIWPGEDEPPWVALDRFGEPAGERLRTDQDEQAGGRYQFGLAGVAVPQQQLIKMPAATAAGDLAAVPDGHMGRRLDLADQVVGHARRQGLRPDEDRDLLCVLRQVQRGLTGTRSAAADGNDKPGSPSTFNTGAPGLSRPAPRPGAHAGTCSVRPGVQYAVSSRC